MLWQVHERHIAKSDFPQFPDGVRLKRTSTALGLASVARLFVSYRILRLI